MRHAAFSLLPPFSILFEFSVHNASVFLAKISSEVFWQWNAIWQFWRGGLGERGGEWRWWQWWRTWIFSSNSLGTWPSRSVSTLFTLVSQWNNDISSCSYQKLQHYSTGTDWYLCLLLRFSSPTVWPERFHLWNLQKGVDRQEWPLNLVLCFRSSPSVKHSLCSWQLG